MIRRQLFPIICIIELGMNAGICVVFLIYITAALAFSVFSNYLAALFGASLSILVTIATWKNWVKPKGTYFSGLQSKGVKKQNWALLVYFGIVFLLSTFFWLAYYPGGFNLDAYGQWDQAHGSLPYSDWHPIMSTLLIKLVLSVCDSFPFYILVQLFLFSISVALLLATLQGCGIDTRLLVGTALLIGLSPAVGLNSICMTKDVQFTILIVNLTTCFAKAVFSNGKWLERGWHIVILGAISGLAILVRHNGFLFVIPAFVILLLSYSPQSVKTICAALIALVFVLIIKVPVSQRLNVAPHENVVGEAVGIPMAVLANALTSDVDNFPADAHSFMNEIASDEEWIAHYYPGEWDSCKWEFGGTELLRNRSIGEVLRYAWETVLHCPQAAYTSARLNTRIVWNPLYTDPYWIPEDYIEENDVGITEHPVVWLRGAVEFGISLSMLPLISLITWNTGFQIAALMLTYCFRYKVINAKKLLLLVPLLAYDGGTMLLLAGPNQRYFYCNAVLYVPIILFLLLKEPYEAEKDEEICGNYRRGACGVDCRVRIDKESRRKI